MTEQEMLAKTTVGIRSRGLEKEALGSGSLPL
jgi:hypothetical protein